LIRACTVRLSSSGTISMICSAVVITPPMVCTANSCTMPFCGERMSIRASLSLAAISRSASSISLASTARSSRWAWARTFSSTDYNETTAGWNYTVVDHGQAAETNMSAKVRIYDTTLLGYGNGGHTYGDELTEENRRAVLEYLKTL